MAQLISVISKAAGASFLLAASFISAAFASDAQQTEARLDAEVNGAIARIADRATEVALSDTAPWASLRPTSRMTDPYALWHDDRLNVYLDEVTDQLLAGRLPADVVEIDLRACPQVMARISTGNYGVVCIELLRHTRSVDELAFALAHEIAHAALNDLGVPPHMAIRTDANGVMKPPATDTLDEEWSDFAQPSFVELSAGERNADEMAVDFMVAQGFAPLAAITLVARLPNDRGSHYADPDARSAALQTYIDAHYPYSADLRSSRPHPEPVEAALAEAGTYLADLTRISLTLSEQSAHAAGLPSAPEAEQLEVESIDDRNRRACSEGQEPIAALIDEYGYTELNFQLVAMFEFRCTVYAPGMYYKNLVSDFQDLSDFGDASLYFLVFHGMFSAEAPTVERAFAEIQSRFDTPFLAAHRGRRGRLEGLDIVNYDENRSDVRVVTELRRAYSNASSAVSEVCQAGGLAYPYSHQAYEQVIGDFVYDFVDRFEAYAYNIAMETSRARMPRRQFVAQLVTPVGQGCGEIYRHFRDHRIATIEQTMASRLAHHGPNPPRNIVRREARMAEMLMLRATLLTYNGEALSVQVMQNELRARVEPATDAP